jgi:CRISPR-associated protein Csx10
MKTYLVKILVESPLLPGSGSGTALIDTDVVYHKTGFPYLPAKRLRGLLRESLMEVLEMKGEASQSKVDELFGNDDQEGKIQMGNAYLPNWSDIKRQLPRLKFNEEYINREDIINYFCFDISRTAIDNEGVADDHTLRTFRVIKPGVEFQCELTLPDLGLQDVMDFAVLNLRRMGIGRNRGFGKVKCSMDKNYVKTEHKSVSPTLLGTTKGIKVNLTTLAPIVLGTQMGDQNAVATANYFTGNKLMGILASEYIKACGLGKKAHEDSGFKALFLSGKLKFGYLLPASGSFAPRNIHALKDNPTSLVDIFGESQKNVQTKPLLGIVDIQGGSVRQVSIQKELFFHNARPDRVAGQSLEDNGSIFYYEALGEQQLFTGHIYADDTSLLQKLVSTLGSSIVTYTGKSKNTQYGKVQIDLASDETKQTSHSNENDKGDFVLIKAESHLLLRNQFGTFEPTAENWLKSLIKPEGGTLSIKNSNIQVEPIEQYNVVWDAKSDKVHAIAPGSVILCEFKPKKEVKLTDITWVGDKNHHGFGKCSISKVSETTYSKGAEIDCLVSSKQGTEEVRDAILVAIQKQVAKKRKEQKIKVLALDNVVKHARYIKGHLIGRLESVWKEAKSPADIKSWLETIEGKQAESTLFNAGILRKYDKDKSKYFLLNHLKVDEDAFDFKMAQMYWLTLLENLRKTIKTQSHGK